MRRTLVNLKRNQIKKMENINWPIIFDALSALASIATCLIAWLAYRKLLKNRVSEKQLDEVLKLGGQLKNIDAHFTMPVFDGKNVTVKHLTLKIFDIRHHEDLSSYALVAPVSINGWYALRNVEIGSLVPDSISSKLTLLREFRHVDLELQNFEGINFRNTPAICIDLVDARQNLFFMYKNGKLVKYKELIECIEGIRGSLNLWIYNKTGILRMY